MFKEQTSKKRIVILNNSKEISTLDVMHNKMIKSFEFNMKEKENYTKQLKILHENQNSLKTFIENTSYDDDNHINLWSSNIILTEQLINLKDKINKLNKYDEIDYYEKTSDILFEYYEKLEKQYCENKQNFKHKYTNRTILDALNNVKNTDDNKNINSIIITDKSTLVDEYLSIVHKQHVKKSLTDDIELCPKCNKQMICLQHDAIIICDSCGNQELLLVEQNRPILKQNTKDTSHFSYKRINHFREWCNQVQGKESTDIPDEIFEKILNEIKKEKIIDTKYITYSKMREILKRLRINKYYEHINYIINRINGIPTPQFSPELEEKLCNMFRDIQVPFLKYCPKDRKNFLSYSYVLYKFFQILGLNEYLKYFPLLKSREKLYVQDQIWKQICKDLNYEFIPSPFIKS